VLTFKSRTRTSNSYCWERDPECLRLAVIVWISTTGGRVLRDILDRRGVACLGIGSEGASAAGRVKIVGNAPATQRACITTCFETVVSTGGTLLRQGVEAPLPFIVFPLDSAPQESIL